MLRICRLILLLLVIVVIQRTDSYAHNGYQQPKKVLADTAGFFNSFDRTRIYYEVKGTGFPVILVHGFVNSGEAWKRTGLYTNLPAAGYQVVTLDLRGNGQSDKPHNAEAYANDAEAKDIMALADRLGLKKYNVVGYSRGSIITARLLVLDKRVNKAVIGGMGTDFTNPQWPRRIMFYKGLMGEPVPEVEGLLKYIKEAKLDQLALAYMQKEQPSTSKAALAKIKQPILVIIGTEDEDKGKAGELAALFKKGEFKTTPGEHGSALRTREFSDEIASFFAKK